MRHPYDILRRPRITAKGSRISETQPKVTFEVPCDAVVINRLLPEAAASEAFFRDWSRVQEERRREMAELFAPLAMLEAPLQDDEVMGLERLSAHGQQLFAGVEPDAVLSVAPRLRFAREGAGYRAVIPLPHAEREELDVTKVEDELVIRAGSRRRALKLPRRIAPLVLSGARLERGVLTVHFDRDAAGAS